MGCLVPTGVFRWMAGRWGISAHSLWLVLKLDSKKPHYSSYVKKRPEKLCWKGSSKDLSIGSVLHVCIMPSLWESQNLSHVRFSVLLEITVWSCSESPGSFAGKLLKDAALVWPCWWCMGRPSAWD